MESSVKRCNPSIQQVTQDYNQLCNTMTRLIRKHKAPIDAICPSKIETKEIWALDVDNDIWQDIGLLNDAPEPTPLPWLCDETVRDGIKALPKHDHCLEEDAHLQKEY